MTVSYFKGITEVLDWGKEITKKEHYIIKQNEITGGAFGREVLNENKINKIHVQYESPIEIHTDNVIATINS